MPAITKFAACTTDAQRTKLAAQILRLRENGVAWDGTDGIVAQGFVSGAPQGRALLRQYGKRNGRKVATGNGIAKSYDRTPEFRASESERRTAKAEPVKVAKPRKPRKVAAQKKTAKAGK